MHLALKQLLKPRADDMIYLRLQKTSDMGKEYHTCDILNNRETN